MRTAPRGNVRWGSVACLLLLVCTGTSLGSPTISWSGERDVPITYPSNVSFDWDANGISDLLMEMTRQPADIFVEAFDENRTPVTDDMEAASLPIAEGTSIGPYLDIGGVSWAAGRHEMAGLRDVDGQVIGGGYWAYVDRGFMGLEFRMGDEIHYGWARISVFTPGLGDNAFALVHDWAYETIPGQSILAGSVPEPSTMALAILGGAVVLAWKVIMRSKVQGSGVL